MEKRSTPGAQDQRNSGHEHPLPQEISQREKLSAENAHDQAEQDMENDVELSAHSSNDDLDEAESARLGEESTDLV
jgi:hypothetical protein